MTQHMSIDHGRSSEVADDPNTYLSSIGIDIDPETRAVLQSKLAAAANGQQAAAIVHFDS